MTSQQGWDRAEFTCGRCFATVTAETEREYIRLVADHKANCPAASAARTPTS
ncbi:hypothetical protein ACFVYP_06940 [Kitasatospora sp. NPDC058201]|uniref:hypothetical protein n=1 Tax=unclassified Kitasatospora TaxID=2633591 RepID=UPI00365A8F35